MRYIAVITLTLLQFTAFPFLAMVAANTERQQSYDNEHKGDQAVSDHNTTTIYKMTTL